MLFLDTIITGITLNNKMLTRCKVKMIILFQDWNNARATYYFHKSRGEKKCCLKAVAAIRIMPMNRDIFLERYRDRKSRAKLLTW